MKMYKARNVGDYIRGAKKEAQPILKELREIMKETVPEVEEKISWGVPFYRYNGLLGGFVALKGHVSFGLVSYLTPELRKEFETAGYVTKKKIVQIGFAQKVPVALIKKLVKERVVANEERKKL